jgi:hypothetical protein
MITAQLYDFEYLKELPFPKLMATAEGTVVLFQSERAFKEGEGIVLCTLTEEDASRVGKLEDKWIPAVFADFIGTLTLTNTTEGE